MDSTDLLRVAEIAAASSRDPSTKTGCVIARPDGTVVGRGFNGPPSPIVLTESQARHRPTRLAMTVHAEARALLDCCPRSPRGATAYVWPWPPCAPCMALLAEAGVARVVAPAPDAEMVARWGESFVLAYELARGADIEVELR